MQADESSSLTFPYLTLRDHQAGCESCRLHTLIWQVQTGLATFLGAHGPRTIQAFLPAIHTGFKSAIGSGGYRVPGAPIVTDP